MRETGLEPARYYYHQALNLARLPIPPFPQRSEPEPPRHPEASRSFWAGSGDSQAACTGFAEIDGAAAAEAPRAAIPRASTSVQTTSPTGIQR
jgi:hypothetical protein